MQDEHDHGAADPVPLFFAEFAELHSLESGRLTQESRDRRSEIWDLILRVRNLNCCLKPEISDQNEVEVRNFGPGSEIWVRNLGPKFGTEIPYFCCANFLLSDRWVVDV